MSISKISNLIFPYRQLLVGFSGGLDSTVLLHKLKLWRDQESGIEIRAVHIHHGLSPNADNWVEHCKKLCYEWKIPLIVVHVFVTNNGLGIEAQARKARYKVFEKTLLPGEALVIAHHLDDQCETFLLALKRGSGPAGLSAMSSRIKFSTTQLLRPLLYETRESLETWAQTHSLRWIEDESNQNDRYDRNFLRLRIIPLLNKRWPHIATSISRSASLCAEQENLINELLNDELKKLVSKEGALYISPLTKMSVQRRSALLRRWLLSQGSLMPSRSMLNRIWKEVAEAHRNTIPCIYLNNHEIRRFKGLLWRIKPQPSCKDIVIVWERPYESLILPQGMGRVFFRKGGHTPFPSPKEIVSIRFKASGTIRIIGRHGGCKLKKIWKELNVPPWERTTIPLLFYDETLIAAAGKFLTTERWVEEGMSFEREL